MGDRGILQLQQGAFTPNSRAPLAPSPGPVAALVTVNTRVNTASFHSAAAELRETAPPGLHGPCTLLLQLGDTGEKRETLPPRTAETCSFFKPHPIH